MLVFQYDKTFDGLLSAVFDAYTSGSFPDALMDARDSALLLAARTHQVATTEEKSGRVFQGLEKRLSPRALDDMLRAWLSGEEKADMMIFRYIRKVFAASRCLENDLADPDIFAVIRLARQVRREHHQLEGFIRFQKSSQGVYFAALAPRHDVLPLLLHHFSERFAEQSWILYDVTRGYGFLFARKQLHDVYLEESLRQKLARNGGRLDNNDLAEKEAFFQELWKAYFQATAIKERLNPRLQSRCMPRRYWPYMTEKRGE